jgi:hypothetical protein
MQIASASPEILRALFQPHPPVTPLLVAFQPGSRQ